MTVAVVAGSTALSSSYAALLAELGDFTKSMSADDKGGPEKVEAAAAEGGAELPEGEQAAPKKEGGEEEEEEGEGEDMTKSFAVTLPDGSVQKVIDAGEMLKSLKLDMGTLQGGVADLTAQLAVVTAERDAALQLSTGLLSAVKTQGDMLKSLTADVAKIGNTGSGRKATLTVTEAHVAPVAPAAANTVSADEFFAKAMTLVGTDDWTARDIALAEARISHGLPPQADLAAAVAKIA